MTLRYTVNCQFSCVGCCSYGIIMSEKGEGGGKKKNPLTGLVHIKATR